MSEETGWRSTSKDLREAPWQTDRRLPGGIPEIYEFGPFRLEPAERKLLRGNEVVALTPKAFDTLHLLVRNSGHLLQRDELIRMLWPQSVVEEGNLTNNIFLLRKALGEDVTYIETVSKKGYRFVGAVRRLPTADPARPESPLGGRGDSAHRRQPDATPGRLTPETATQPEAAAAANTFHVTIPRGRRAFVIALVVAVVCTPVLTWVWMAHRDRLATTSPIPEKSIAVLPFVDMSEKHDQEYFADGMAEEVLDLLVKVPGLRVIGRTSSFQFKGKGEDVHSVAAKLGVSFMVEGTAHKSGDTIRVTSQLLRTQDGTRLWSETYDRKVGDTLRVQSDIAHGIARALELTITDITAISREPLRSPEAYSVYLKGRHAIDRYDQTGFEEGAADFQQALQLDPTFAPAAAWLAWTYNAQAEWNYAPSARMEDARNALQRVMRLDPQLALAHALLAEIHIRYDWDWAAGDREVKLALGLEPHNEWPLDIASNLEAAFGRWDEAVRYSNEAIAVSPLSAAQWWVLGVWRLRSGRLDEAEAAIRKALEISPTFVGAHSWLGRIYLLRGQPEAARVEMERDENIVGLTLVYHALGRQADSDRMLERATEEVGETAAYSIAQIHAFRGETDAAFEWLERAYRQKDLRLAFLKGDPLLRSLEHDPRYDELLRKMNLPKSSSLPK